MTEDRRLIEDYLPIQAISAEASREKNVRKGHISTLHLWWARRPLVAARAAVYGALVPFSRFVPPQASAAKAHSLARANAARFVERLCKYPGDARVIAEAQQHILEAHAERLSAERGETVTAADIEAGRAPRPRVLDMFAGGGAIPLEALRLGCEAYALDLNPVAHIIELCTLVYPQRYGQPDPTELGATGPPNAAGNATWGGLAAEVRYWGNWVLERVRAEIGDLYPLVPDPQAQPQELISEPSPMLFQDARRQQRLRTEGQFLTPVAYLWTRTVTCKNPNCGASVPLVKQTWLCKKKDRYVAMRMLAPKGSKRTRFEIVEAATEAELGFDPEAFSKGGNATCLFCRTVADVEYIKAEGRSGRLSQELMAIACIKPKMKGKGLNKRGNQGKIYLSADDHPNLILDETIVERRIEELCLRTGLTVPDEPMPVQGTLGFRVQPYGLTKWSSIYTKRQMLCLMTFSAYIRESENEASKISYGDDQLKALITYLAVILDRLADFNSTGCTWNYTGGRGVLHTMARQALPMVWDFAETYPFNSEGASWVSGISDVPAALDTVSNMTFAANVIRTSATQQPLEDRTFDAVVTDPPYYDNVPYADISDFFYVWLKRNVGRFYPEHFSAELTPKKKEAIAEPVRHGGDKEKANAAYEGMMRQAFSEANRVLKQGGQMTVVYAHKTTLGWSTLVDALRRSDFTVTEAWPLDTERAGRLRAMDSAALASSIFLVARKRDGAQTGYYENEVQPELERIVRERVETLWAMGITGADLVIASVGAGLRAFTRFERVEYDNGEEVPAEKFLAEVEGVVLETLLEKIFGLSRSGVAAVDGASRFYVLWRYAYGARELDAGEAIVFAYPQSVELDGARGLTQGVRALVEKKKNKYRLRDFTERGQRDDLGLPDEEQAGKTAAAPVPVVPLIDVLHRILWLLENRPRLLPEFLRQASPDRERLRLVAQALAGPALKGGETETKTISTTAAEASALGKLLANWRTLIEAPLEEKPLFSPAKSN